MMMIERPTPTAEELLRKIQNLERDHHHLKHMINNNTTTTYDYYYYNNNINKEGGGGGSCSSYLSWQSESESESKYVNILESMGQSVYMFDVHDRIVYWNHMSEILYGYTAAEAVGKTAPDIIIEPIYSDLATLIIQRAVQGETWSGQFPIRTKHGDRFNVITTLSPCRDQYGTTFGVTCVCADTRHFRQHLSPPPPQPLQTTSIVSKISNMASKVKLKTHTNMDHDPGDHFDGNHTTHSKEGTQNKPWIGITGISWPWKENENRASSDLRRRFGWPWLHKDQEQDSGPLTGSTDSSKLDGQPYESPISTKEAPGSLCSYSSATNSSSSSINEIDIHIENLDVEILWDDLIIREQIGQGSHATVYHALLYGSDVAVKIFNKQGYPDDVIQSFRKEVFLMKRLRHPNILLFMGAVISTLHLCIVTELPPRGSLFRLLQRSTTKLDWKRRVNMAMDIARGMNYLHRSQPPIIHRNLKSSNLLIDLNLTLKVCDFGLSRIKRETYLATNTEAGTAQWMAPEILRNEQVDEKSDVYSYGVVLWEITTGKIPWDNLNSMQVIKAVGFMNQRLEIPDDVDPQWASLIESCWSREPRARPTFEEILIKLKDLQKKFSRDLKSYKKKGTMIESVTS